MTNKTQKVTNNLKHSTFELDSKKSASRHRNSQIRELTFKFFIYFIVVLVILVIFFFIGFIIYNSIPVFRVYPF